MGEVGRTGFLGWGGGLGTDGWLVDTGFCTRGVGWNRIGAGWCRLNPEGR